MFRRALVAHVQGLKPIVIPSSVVVLGKASFYQCTRLRSNGFEGSRLNQIEEHAVTKGSASVVTAGHQYRSNGRTRRDFAHSSDVALLTESFGADPWSCFFVYLSVQ
jgi:hypothetical protein